MLGTRFFFFVFLQLFGGFQALGDFIVGLSLCFGGFACGRFGCRFG
jgi:hypothetical protein